MRLVTLAKISADGGLLGDHAGKRPDRLVSMLSWEGWQAACVALDPPADPELELPWTIRRANLLVQGVALPRAAGGIVQIGGVTLELTGFTYPCVRMEEARKGLLKALAKDWRGGVLCKVLEAGSVQQGDSVTVIKSPPEVIRKLP